MSEILENKEVVESAPAMPEAALQVDETEIRRVKDTGSDSIPEKKKFFYTKKVCKFCTRQLETKVLDYKNIDVLRRYVMPSGKILPRRISGNCAKHQRMAVTEVKKARIIALLPFLDR
jgi:small subunit ribosomal protein S18